MLAKQEQPDHKLELLEFVQREEHPGLLRIKNQLQILQALGGSQHRHPEVQDSPEVLLKAW